MVLPLPKVSSDQLKLVAHSVPHLLEVSMAPPDPPVLTTQMAPLDLLDLPLLVVSLDPLALLVHTALITHQALSVPLILMA